MLLWRDYFKRGTIVGLDLNPVQIDDPTGRIRIYQGYQQDIAVLDRIAQEQAPEGFDVIIDDCSHIAQPTRVSFWHLFVNHLKEGGIYAIEDIGTGYMRDWIDGHGYQSPHLPLQRLTISPAKSSLQHGQTRESLLDSLTPSARRLLPHGISQSLTHSPRFLGIYTRLRNLTSPYRYSRRTPSHMYGMVGFAKEMLDVCIRGDSFGGAKIHEIRVSLNHAIVVKS